MLVSLVTLLLNLIAFCLSGRAAHCKIRTSVGWLTLGPPPPPRLAAAAAAVEAPIAPTAAAFADVPHPAVAAAVAAPMVPHNVLLAPAAILVIVLIEKNWN
jgi:hypothetical protein